MDDLCNSLWFKKNEDLLDGVGTMLLFLGDKFAMNSAKTLRVGEACVGGNPAGLFCAHPFKRTNMSRGIAR